MNIPIGTMVSFLSANDKVVRGRVFATPKEYPRLDVCVAIEVHPHDRDLIHTHGGLGLVDAPNGFCVFMREESVKVDKSEVLKQFISQL